MSDDIINSKHGETDSHWFISAISMVKLMQSSILSSGSRRRPKKICQKILLTKNFIGPQQIFWPKSFFAPNFLWLEIYRLQIFYIKMYLRMEFDSAVCPTCLCIIPNIHNTSCQKNSIYENKRKQCALLETGFEFVHVTWIFLHHLFFMECFLPQGTRTNICIT